MVLMSFHPLFHLSPRPHRELSPSTSTRKQHIRFTYDILHVCLQRGDLVRARRAWSILVRCPEIDLKTIWPIGLALIGEEPRHATREHVGYLKRVRLQIPEMQETLLKETVLALIAMGEFQEALDELDLYIVTMPFDENPVLHVYAGMLWLYTAQPQRETRNDEVKKLAENSTAPLDTRNWDTGRMASAKQHFRRALVLDPDNMFARGFLDRLGATIQETQREVVEDVDMVLVGPRAISDEDEVRPVKKARGQSK